MRAWAWRSGQPLGSWGSLLQWRQLLFHSLPQYVLSLLVLHTFFFLLSQDSGAGDIVAFPPLFEPSGLGDKRLKDLHLILSWMLSIQFGTYLLLHPCEVRCCLC